jgi:hypothetical protein
LLVVVVALVGGYGGRWWWQPFHPVRWCYDGGDGVGSVNNNCKKKEEKRTY